MTPFAYFLYGVLSDHFSQLLWKFSLEMDGITSSLFRKELETKSIRGIVYGNTLWKVKVCLETPGKGALSIAFAQPGPGEKSNYSMFSQRVNYDSSLPVHPGKVQASHTGCWAGLVTVISFLVNRFWKHVSPLIDKGHSGCCISLSLNLAEVKLLFKYTKFPFPWVSVYWTNVDEESYIWVFST